MELRFWSIWYLEKRFLNIPCSQHWVDKLSRIVAFISQRLLADFINATCSAVDHRRAAS